MESDYISKDIIKKITDCSPNRPVKLIAISEAMNDNYRHEHYCVVIVLVRAVLDYIPTVFNFQTSKELIAEISNKRTLKNALKTVDNKTRRLADEFLHNPAHTTESIKIDKSTCNDVKNDLVLILDETANFLKDHDYRKAIPIKRFYKKQLSQTDIIESFIEKGKDNWEEKRIDDKSVWIYKLDNQYQIQEVNEGEPFAEEWTQVYPSPIASMIKFRLFYNNVYLDEVNFAYCDGYRIRVALPRIGNPDKPNRDYDESDSKYKYYWEKKSIEFKLMGLVGKFHCYESPVGIARMSKIKII